MFTIPPERYQEVIASQGDRVFEEPNHSFTYLGVPQYLEEFQDTRIARRSRWRSTGSRSSTRSSTAGSARPRAR